MRLAAAGLLLLSLSGLACYAMRPSAGGGQISERAARVERECDPADVAVPRGYRVELVARGLTFPTGLCWDGAGALHVVESGYCYGEVWTTPRLLRVDPGGGTAIVASGHLDGPWNGVDFADGAFWVAAGGALTGGSILRIAPDGTTTTLVDGLPSRGDHHTNGPRVRDGWVYFGQGTATNSGVVGGDSAEFGWLGRNPLGCDLAGGDVELSGAVFETADFTGRLGGRARTAAFSPFGAATSDAPPRAITGVVPCNGAVLRVRVGGGPVELVAWGFRNPFGLAFGPEGELYATDNGYDDRGSRPVWGAPDLLWRVERGTWYGWPDYSGNQPLTAARFAPPGGHAPRFLLARHPNVPPRPRAQFGVHASADGFDVAPNAEFGRAGDAYVALFGDQAPTTGKLLAPVGFEVVRVDLARGVVEPFAANRGATNGPASKVGGRGLERPIAVRFDPSGTALYVVDFGVLRQDEKGAHPVEGTGVVWRIVREVRR